MKTSDILVRIEHPDSASPAQISKMVFAVLGRATLTREVADAKLIKALRVTPNKQFRPIPK